MSTPLVRTTRLATAYRRYLSTADGVEFATAVAESYSPATLAHLLSRGDVELRRAAALALGTVGQRSSIDPLGRALADPDRGVRLVADDSFRLQVSRDAAPLHHQQLLQCMHAIDGGQYAGALPLVMILCDRAPLYAEAHHQLGVCWQGLDDFEAASRAYSACLWRCRFHYPAWLGWARCRESLGDDRAAIRGYERANEILPDLEIARLSIRALRRRQQGKR
ncbi:MAG: HEAT repeat domain-containing protein [Planctomycetota bacterium]